ncbi:hypothetical protein SODALDRAFT_100031 [Sodiomyces alkalinus F11]|uniref:Uncharacterized protein n=1 Tax=Sodiomyces alkalinus (strain CBS 110278 / VKM F-3762 / F11) TaxID=1314773 RepID=A0A3N2Q1E0_SODAK|nr:hypothetical protein SODALDRAFT_100031 [Sodiomyces alkalinus F11]ROT40581.1 hypothetical protein SODALDRAFT_100031 [Sodiomyces alkalinus F11]
MFLVWPLFSPGFFPSFFFFFLHRLMIPPAIFGLQFILRRLDLVYDFAGSSNTTHAYACTTLCCTVVKAEGVPCTARAIGLELAVPYSGWLLYMVSRRCTYDYDSGLVSWRGLSRPHSDPDRTYFNILILHSYTVCSIHCVRGGWISSVFCLHADARFPRESGFFRKVVYCAWNSTLLESVIHQSSA